MFARTLTALFLCAAPALASPPAAPMPRAAGELPPFHWHSTSFDALRRTVYGDPPACVQTLREDVYRLASGEAAPPHEKRVAQLFVFGLVQVEGAPVPVQPRAAQVEPPTQPGLGQFVAVADPLVCPPCPLPKIEVNPLLGTWFREVPGCVACATFTHDELKLTFAESDGTKHTATAQYTVTKDGLVFGAITGTTGPASLVDVPFSFRFRVTSDGVMVSAFKSEPMGDTSRFCGLFKSAKDGKVPAPVAAKPSYSEGFPLGVSPPSAPTQLKEPVRPASLESAPAVLPPVLDGPPPMPPKRAIAPPDAMKAFADDAFGSLLQQSGVLPKPEPDPLLLAPPAKKLAHVGTWDREIGPMTCVVKIDAEHVTITATVSGEENGKKIKQGVVITGDYHLARDGTTLVGLVTGLDVIVEGLTGKETESLMGLEEVAKMQKALVGQPFALGVRAYGDVLVIGDVRVGHASERGIEEASAMVSGRYRSGEPKGAEPKRLPRATGANVPRIPMADADDHARVKELLFESDTSGPPRLFNQYSSDPNVRMKQLLKQSEDLRNIQNEWMQFWFEAKPQHLTPERIHGGIY